MQLDFALDTFRRRFPDRHVVQLAIDGSIPFAALADISVHTGFAGTVLCDVRADCMTAYGTPSDVQSQYVRYHDREWGLNRRANRFLSSQAQQRLAIVNPALGLNGLIKGALARGWQRPLYYTRADRETFFDYALMPAPVRRGLEAYDANTVRQARATYDRRGRAAWEADADRIAALARNIRARGGRVIFARFPTSGEVRQQEDRLFPGAAFWEPFIHRTGVVGLNYADSPALTRFQCPEGSHLDYREAASFTERLWDEIEARQGRRASDFPGF